MDNISLTEIALLLAAAAIAVPIARRLHIGTVLGYLLAGIALGPFGAGQVFSIYQAKEFLHFAEFGIVLLLFLIGLEMRPRRLWSLRSMIIGLGGLQVFGSAILLSVAALAVGFAWQAAVFLGLALALSSTAFAIQVLEEKNELTARHGRAAFSILLFQDVAAIPLIALTPIFAVASLSSEAGAGMSLSNAFQAVAMIALVIIVGRFVVEHALRLVAQAQVKEAMTATALLMVVGAAAIMQMAGLSPALGGFIAGALLAESSYRHQLEADLKPFEGLLLGLFFIAIGMSLQFDILVAEPVTIVSLVIGLIAIKFAVLYGLGRWHGLPAWSARRLGFSMSQGGEFAFVLLTAGAAAGVVNAFAADLGALVVTLSMIGTPLLLMIDDTILRRPGPAPSMITTDPLPASTGHVVIAGFGRVGQIAARVLRARRIPFTALDLDPEQIELVKRFGNEAFFGDASRADILAAARVRDARALVLAVDDVEASIRIATIVRTNHPDLPIYARARDRVHYHRLMELGLTHIWRETYASSLAMTKDLLRGVGLNERDAKFTIETFDAHDRKRLIDDYEHYTDLEKLQEQAQTTAENLARVFDEDTRERSGKAGTGSDHQPPTKAEIQE